ncbi:DUF4149 domain-containing protein [Brachymonas denitrificans]|uniref:DUF4149 domain-containing protein n=1 Tax=Brachymonas denitrificans TaxID=28220 RepID=UPI001BCFA037|nr:DUF4149 domain-containing protein [Brachymonas denitrificans]
MSPRQHVISSLLAALWLGSLSAIGFMAVPLLFAHLPTPSMAGTMAARLFAAQGWVSILSVLLLVMLFRSRLRDFSEKRYEAGQGVTLDNIQRPDMLYFGLLIAGLLLALLLQLVAAPRIEMRQNLALWHSVGTVFYVGQWLCALVCVIRLAQRKV